VTELVDSDTANSDFLSDRSRMSVLIRALDWSATPLGPIHLWPQSLRTAVSIMLASRFPMLIWWGSDLVKLYNDAYIALIGAKHPTALGKPGREVWPEIWDVISPMLNSVSNEGTATWSENQMLLLGRNGYLEECYFTFSYSPISDETGGIGGVFTVVTETTAQIVNERRSRTLHELAARAGEAKTATEAGRIAAETLALNPQDVPFALIYLLKPDRQRATLIGSTGTNGDAALSPPVIDLYARAPNTWPLAEADSQPMTVPDLAARFSMPKSQLLSAAWDTPPTHARLLPIVGSQQEQPLGYLVSAISPHRALDDAYALFLSMIAEHVATSIANAHIYEEERESAAALATSALENQRLYHDIQQAMQRTSQLQEVTAELTGTLTLAEVGAVFIRQGALALGGASCFIDLLTDAQMLVPIQSVGYDPELLEPWQHFSVDTPVPIAEAVRSGEPIWLHTLQSWNARYPLFQLEKSEYVSWAVLPLIVKGRTIGGIGFSFEQPQAFGERDQAFLVAFTRQCAQAIDRATLYEAEKTARTQAQKAEAKLALLAQAGMLLATSLDYETTLSNLAQLLVPELADYYALDLIDADHALRRVAVVAQNAAIQEAMSAIARDYPPDPNSATVRAVLSSGKTMFVADASDDLYHAMAQDEQHLYLMHQIGFVSFVMLPLIVRTQAIGVMTLSMANSSRHYSESDLPLMEELARRAAQAIENAQLYRQARQSIAVRDEFLVVAAHELKTPVTSLRGFTQLLLRQLNQHGTVDPTRLETTLHTLDSQSAKLTTLIGTLLNVSRLESGKLTLERSLIDVVALANGVATAMQTNATLHNIHVHAPAALLLRADPLRLEQVLSNLLDNAVKYSPDGGAITVDISVEQAMSEDKWACISVTDHGIGIPAERRASIFDRFVQAHGEGFLGGMGLGLYISQQIVELHEGQLSAEFPDEGGTRFVIRLPIGTDADSPQLDN